MSEITVIRISDRQNPSPHRNFSGSGYVSLRVGDIMGFEDFPCKARTCVGNGIEFSFHLGIRVGFPRNHRGQN